MYFYYVQFSFAMNIENQDNTHYIDFKDIKYISNLSKNSNIIDIQSAETKIKSNLDEDSLHIFEFAMQNNQLFLIKLQNQNNLIDANIVDNNYNKMDVFLTENTKNEFTMIMEQRNNNFILQSENFYVVKNIELQQIDKKFHIKDIVCTYTSKKDYLLSKNKQKETEKIEKQIEEKHIDEQKIEQQHQISKEIIINQNKSIEQIFKEGGQVVAESFKKFREENKAKMEKERKKAELILCAKICGVLVTAFSLLLILYKYLEK